MQANWFVALSVAPGDFLAQLSPPPCVRLFGPHDLHITVAFLGTVGEERARAAFAEAKALTLGALETELGEVVPLGSKRRPSAFSALPISGRRELEHAMASVRAAMWQTAGARSDDRPALAHVTIARPTRKASHEQVHDAAAWAKQLDLGRPRVRIERVALYTWAEDRAQSLFRVVDERAL